MGQFAKHIDLLENSQDNSKTVVFTYGRFNPPTKGHGKLIETVKTLASEMNADYFIIPSHKVDESTVAPEKRKNPLTFEVKLSFMETLYPDTIFEKEATFKSPWQIPTWLGEQGYTDVRMVVGEDQVADFTRLANQAGKYFNSFEIVNAGVRNPDEDGLTGMSATKAREAVLENNIGKFRAATGWDGETSRLLMETTQKGMGLNE